MIKQFVLALLSVLSVLGWQVSAAQILEVDTASGKYQGLPSPVVSDVSVFRGLALPRHRSEICAEAPEPPVTFSGVRLAERSGPACWQARNSDNSVYARGNLDRSEDCLALNVFTAAVDDSAGLPVMVWFHGGSNTAGHGGAQIFDGSNLAARGAVVVTANYRLGPLGFLAHPALTAESEQAASGNYGLLDQVAALQWVQKNIARFGGDPTRVIIFGQSAGGEDVCLLMASPLTTGLIHRVIGQSSPAGVYVWSEALRAGRIPLTREESGSWRRWVSRIRERQHWQPCEICRQKRLLLQRLQQAIPMVPLSMAGFCRTRRRVFLREEYNRVPVMMGALAEGILVCRQERLRFQRRIWTRF